MSVGAPLQLRRVGFLSASCKQACLRIGITITQDSQAGQSQVEWCVGRPKSTQVPKSTEYQEGLLPKYPPRANWASSGAGCKPLQKSRSGSGSEEGGPVLPPARGPRPWYIDVSRVICFWVISLFNIIDININIIMPSWSSEEAQCCHPPEAQGLDTSPCHVSSAFELSFKFYGITDRMFSLIMFLRFSILWKGCWKNRSRCAVWTCLPIQTDTHGAGWV